jgi:hypothetical protein
MTMGMTRVTAMGAAFQDACGHLRITAASDPLVDTVARSSALVPTPSPLRDHWRKQRRCEMIGAVTEDGSR